MELDLRDLLRIARRRGWIIVLMMLIVGGSAFGVSSRLDSKYSATATLLIVPTQRVDANELTALQASRSIAETYRLLITTGPVLDSVIEELDLPYDVEELQKRVTTEIVGETQVIEVSAIDGNPELAAQIATTVVEQFRLLMDPDNVANLGANENDAVLGQTSDAANESTDTQTNSAETDGAAPGQAEAAQRQVDFFSDELSRVEQPAIEAEQTEPTSSDVFVPVRAQIDIWEPAPVPTEPFEPRPILALVLGLLGGFLLGVALIALIEFLDNTVKPEQNLQTLVGAPVLTTVSRLAKLQPGWPQLYTMSQPRSAASEAMRLLRTNLDFASASGELKTLVISSPGPGEGKSTITANLGVVMAQAGMKTAILDGDLRKPTQHRIFGAENDRGLTTLLTHPDESWMCVAKQVAQPNLFLIPSGPIPPNPADLLSSDRFHQLLERIQQDVDLILIDTPPIHSVSDSLSLAAHADGVLLICQSHKTRIDALRYAADAAGQGRIRLVGVVINGHKGSNGSYYYGEYYGSEPAVPVSAPGD